MLSSHPSLDQITLLAPDCLLFQVSTALDPGRYLQSTPCLLGILRSFPSPHTYSACSFLTAFPRLLLPRTFCLLFSLSKNNRFIHPGVSWTDFFSHASCFFTNSHGSLSSQNVIVTIQHTPRNVDSVLWEKSTLTPGK